MQIQLSDHFSYGRLLRFALPSIIMMLFTSIYSVVDGLFVSNVVGESAFASINLIIGSDGIWLAMFAAECCVLVVTVIALVRGKKRFKYA